jgi:hypothetical protein
LAIDAGELIVVTGDMFTVTTPIQFFRKLSHLQTVTFRDLLFT